MLSATAASFRALLVAAIISEVQPEQVRRSRSGNPTTRRKPNVLIIIADDLGYADLASFGHTVQEWTGVDDMAMQGTRFTQFYAGDSLCTPSRSALMTGRLPPRIGVYGNASSPRVFLPNGKQGLPHEEWTLPEMFRENGYKTGMVGKWHLGINENTSTDGVFLPTHRFDFVGTNLPWTNYFNCSHTHAYEYPHSLMCFVYNGSQIIQQPIKYERLTQMLLDDFERFVESSPEPWFFYFSFPQVHTELFSPLTSFKDTSARGVFGGDLNEMGWAVSEIFRVLDEHQSNDDTLSIFMSDHGPHKEICLEGGDAGPLKGGKASTWEGGFRIPVILKWKDVIPPHSVSHSVLSAMDFLPSLAHLIGAPLRPDIKFDGMNNLRYLLDPTLTMDERPIWYYCSKTLMAVRYGRYKVHFHVLPVLIDNETLLYCPSGMPLKDWYISECPDADAEPLATPVVYDLYADQGEKYPIPYSELPEPTRTTIDSILEEHKRGMTFGKPLLDDIDKTYAINPCCNPPDCRC